MRKKTISPELHSEAEALAKDCTPLQSKELHARICWGYRILLNIRQILKLNQTFNHWPKLRSKIYK
jgi:hypothetical protein